MKTEIQQGIHILVNYENDVTAAATVTTGRAALGHELLPAESALAMATVTSLDNDLGSVYELHISSFKLKLVVKNEKPALR
jgi:hypothetical protein